ncbi:MAG TPA: metal-sensing transcriptional repressor [Candidatus Eisenbacteria bacterium]|nr:metal-sensing transcriptional repressor [Candidatus Eisenbacteria bacterium]
MQADPKKVLNRLKTVRGQIEGIIRMVEEDQYCIDISNQLLAAQSILKSTNRIVLQAHLDHCVQESFKNEDQQEEKIQELKAIINKVMK